jgi:acetyl-CoA carboxylase carboxyl transferase subunit beta
MQESLVSLMQMPKTAAAARKLREARCIYVSVLTDPTYGGVTASFAFLGDIILAEPGAAMGFAGPRVVEVTKLRMPPEVQTAEFQYQHGMIDMIVPRQQLRETLEFILRWATEPDRDSSARKGRRP